MNTFEIITEHTPDEIKRTHAYCGGKVRACGIDGGKVILRCSCGMFGPTETTTVKSITKAEWKARAQGGELARMLTGR
jgi:hypothetical protein